MERARLLEYLDEIGIGAILHDPETGEILNVNPQIEELYGYPASELKEMRVGEFSADAYSGMEADQRIQAATDGATQRFEWLVQRQSGEHLWVSVNLTNLTIDDSTYVIGVIRDITEFKERERRLRLLERITRHNLRNKLNSISGYNNTLIKQLKQTDTETEAALDYAKRVKNASQSLETLTSTIRNLQRVVSDAKSSRKSVNVCKIANDVVSSYQSKHPEVEWEIEYDDDLWTSADEGLRLAIEEAVKNTVEHNPVSGLYVSVMVTSQSEPPEYIYLRIKDTGNPIPESEIDVIEGEYTPDQLTHGEGVGLWIMRSVSESLGGCLSIESGAQGNTVEFQLPQISQAPSGHGRE